jgi:UDPglucose 6-dehydrogenase
MGTVWNDFTNPEFILLGRHDESTGTLVKSFYQTITSAEVFETTVENAELIKVTYNTFIGMKIAYANTIMEMCNSLPNTNVDAITAAICMANKRLISPAYLTGGMGDGGGCHPRDNIAMSWLSEKLGISYNFFDAIMMARERQTDFLADLICKERADLKNDMPVVILGKAFKPDTNLSTGSPAVLLGNILKERFVPFSYSDPYCADCDSLTKSTSKRAIFFIGCKHSVFFDVRFPSGSIILDPHRFIPKDTSGEVTVKYIGTGEWADSSVSMGAFSWGGES